MELSKRFVTLKSVSTEVRTEEFGDRSYTIIPVVALIEGVLWPSNADTPELALAEEFGKFPESWNGRPVVFDHPEVDGIKVSAGRLDVLSEDLIGSLYNTEITDRKLKSEIWIDIEYLEAASEVIQDTVKRLSGATEDPVEVSVGVFTVLDGASGEYDGKPYKGIWRNVVPDHLAILPEGVRGACSVEQGCGAPRTNAMGTPPVSMEAVLRAAKECKCKGSCENCAKKIQAAKHELWTKVLETAGLKDAELNDNDRRTALQMALNDNLDTWSYIVAVFSGNFIYETYEGLSRRNYSLGDSGVVALGEEIERVRPETQFVIATEEEKVMDKTKTIAALIANESNSYNEDDSKWLENLSEDQLSKVNDSATLKANEATGASADGTNANENGETSNAAGDTNSNADNSDANVDAAPTNNEAKIQTPQEYINSAPTEVQEVLNEGLRLQKARRDTLIKALTDNTKNSFSAEELQSLDTNQLQKMVTLAGTKEDFTGQGYGGTFETAAADDNAIPEPELLFPKAVA